mgnify:CR=1 FL=1
MGIRDDIAGDWHASLAALAWHVDIGVDEVISETPVNRYDLPEAARAPAAVHGQPAARRIPLWRKSRAGADQAGFARHLYNSHASCAKGAETCV